MVLYHGTDEEAADLILQNGFRVTKSNKLWAGNGIYFFPERLQAVWWARVHKNFPSPVVLSFALPLENLRVLDLRTEVGKLQIEEMLERYYANVLLNDVQQREFTKEQIRCAICDYLFDNENIDAIIAQFKTEQQPYLSPTLEFLDKIGFAMTETQICIKESMQHILHILNVEYI